MMAWGVALFGVATITFSCTSPESSYESSGSWVQIPSSNDGIALFEFESTALPVNAWYALVDTDHPGIDVAVVAPEDSDGRATSTDLAREIQACLLVN